LKHEIIDVKKQSETDIKKFSDEAVKIYEYFDSFNEEYKKMKTIRNANTLIRAKEDVDKNIDEMMTKINKFTFPCLFSSLSERDKYKVKPNTMKDFGNNKCMLITEQARESDKPFKLVAKNKTQYGKATVNKKIGTDNSFNASDISKEQENIKEIEKYGQEDLENKEKGDLLKITTTLISKFNEISLFSDKIKQYKRKIPIKNEEDLHKNNILTKENETLRKKLEEQIKKKKKVNFNNKIIMESQERIIERNNTNNFITKNVRPLTGFTDLYTQTNEKRLASATTKNTNLFRPSTGRPLTSKDNKNTNFRPATSKDNNNNFKI